MLYYSWCGRSGVPLRQKYETRHCEDPQCHSYGHQPGGFCVPALQLACGRKSPKRRSCCHSAGCSHCYRKNLRVTTQIECMDCYICSSHMIVMCPFVGAFPLSLPLCIPDEHNCMPRKSQQQTTKLSGNTEGGLAQKYPVMPGALVPSIG